MYSKEWKVKFADLRVVRLKWSNVHGEKLTLNQFYFLFLDLSFFLVAFILTAFNPIKKERYVKCGYVTNHTTTNHNEICLIDVGKCNLIYITCECFFIVSYHFIILYVMYFDMYAIQCETTFIEIQSIQNTFINWMKVWCVSHGAVKFEFECGDETKTSIRRKKICHVLT